MSKYTDMQARARKAGMWPISKEQAYYAGLEEGSAGHIRTDNGAVIERLERENRELRCQVERLRYSMESISAASWIGAGSTHEIADRNLVDIFHLANSTQKETPRQSLAAVRAEAVDDAVEWLHNNYPKLDGPHLGILTARAQQLRTGGDNE